MQNAGAHFLATLQTLDVARVAEMCGGELRDPALGGELVTCFSSAPSDIKSSLTFIESPTQDGRNPVRAACVLCSEKAAEGLPSGPARIVVGSPRSAFAALARELYPDSIGPARANASKGTDTRFPQSHVSTLAVVEDDVVIEPGAVVGDGAAIGRGSVVGANTVIADGCQIGRKCKIGANATLQYSLLGNDVIIHGGAQIGQDGFGFVPGPEGLERVPQLGRVVIQDKAEIGANSTIDRGALDDTVIGEGTKIDNLVQIGHNVRIGRYCAIAAHTGLSGSVTIGDRCLLGGQVGVADHVTIGSDVQIAASAGVMNDIPDGERWAGAPAVPFKRFFREMAALRKLAGTNKTTKAN